jgi:lysophospholipase L1-like esterase
MKITLIGDSIREQYAPRVKELLGEGYELWWPSENTRFAKYTLRGIFDWSRYMAGSDIVHFNCGLWDMCNLFGDGSFSTEEEYVSNMMRIIDILEKKYRIIVFATTTPAEKRNKFYDEGIVDRFNSIIVPKLVERGVIINDLYSLVAEDTEKYIRDDCVHLSEEGIEVCARQVADLIRSLSLGVGGAEENTPDESAHDTTGAPVLI